MNTIPAIEIKRRGVAALEEGLQKGPLHIIKNNKLACVVLKEEDYSRLLNQPQTSDLWNLLTERPWHGKRTIKDIKNQIQKDRNGWEK